MTPGKNARLGGRVGVVAVGRDELGLPPLPLNRTDLRAHSDAWEATSAATVAAELEAVVNAERERRARAILTS